MSLGALYGDFLVMQRIGFRGMRKLKRFGTAGCSSFPLEVLALPNLAYPFWIRPGTSDAIEVTHTILRECYGQYRPNFSPRFIVDAGAYIGDSACWFLSRYPHATVIAVEPDPENFEVLVRNTSPYGTRVHCINAGLWFRDANLKVKDGGSKIGMYVNEVAPSESDCEALSPQTIVRRFNLPSIDIFKIDIEGAETALFAEDTTPWLSRCNLVYVDIHSNDADLSVATAARRHSFKCDRYREMYVLTRR
jgi:FkbM family methyltransferase